MGNIAYSCVWGNFSSPQRASTPEKFTPDTPIINSNKCIHGREEQAGGKAPALRWGHGQGDA
ncbi:MAG TPA: hypothetical protein VN729_06525 [Ktedonobacteraceae bacterium]|nr:hypothetical protein [Ktedonobacteraceae bacterium]